MGESIPVIDAAMSSSMTSRELSAKMKEHVTIREEDFQANMKNKDEKLMVQLREKYTGIRLHDHDEEEGYNEVREITNIEFHARRPKGYKATTAIVTDQNKLDESKNALQCYQIDSFFHETLITQAVNRGHVLQSSPQADS